MAIANPNQAVSAPSTNQTNIGAMSMVTTLFFMWGFITSLNDVLIPHLQDIFHLNYFTAMLVQFFFFLAYFVFAVPAGKLVEWIGYKRTMVTGLITMGAGAMLFVPAANVPSFPFFLVALTILAAGITVLQVSANPYVSVLGPARTASSRLNLTQAFNSLGTTIAPYLGGILILKTVAKSLGSSFQPKTPDQVHQLSGADLSAYMAALHQYQLQMAGKLKVPYVGIALALVLLGLVIAMFKLPRLETTRDFRPGTGGVDDSIWKYRHTVLGAVGIFTYVGAEVAIGSFLVKYFLQGYIGPHVGIYTAETAAKVVSLYWLGAMIGRFVGSAVLQRLRSNIVLGFSALIAAALVCTSMFSGGYVALITIIAVGFFNSTMFPSIFTLGIAELGPMTGKGSGLLIAAIVGGAIIPLIQGAIADKYTIHHAFVLPVLCYLYIAYYGFKGSTPLRTG
jgi:FHS family L-fucose permease-like MFS transporter